MYIRWTLPDGLHDLVNKTKLRSDKEVELVEVLVLLCELRGGQPHHLMHPQLLQEVDVSNETNLTYQQLIPHYHLQQLQYIHQCATIVIALSLSLLDTRTDRQTDRQIHTHTQSCPIIGPFLYQKCLVWFGALPWKTPRCRPGSAYSQPSERSLLLRCSSCLLED